MYKRHHKYLDALKDGVEFSSDSSDEASESGGAANQPDSSEDESGSEVEEFVVPTVFDEVEEEDSYDIIEERPLMEDELDAQLPEKHRKGEVTEYRCSMCPEKVLNSVSAVRAHLESKTHLERLAAQEKRSKPKEEYTGSREPKQRKSSKADTSPKSKKRGREDNDDTNSGNKKKKVKLAEQPERKKSAKARK